MAENEEGIEREQAHAEPVAPRAHGPLAVAADDGTPLPSRHPDDGSTEGASDAAAEPPAQAETASGDAEEPSAEDSFSDSEMGFAWNDRGVQRRLHVFELGVALLGVLVIAGVVGLVPDVRHGLVLALHGNLHGMRTELRKLGVGGAILLFALLISHAVLFFPSEILNATAGFIYGFLPGLALVCAGWLVSALFAYLLGRTVARPLLFRLFGVRRFLRMRHAVQQGGIPLLLAARLVPVVPSALWSYVAGAAEVPLMRFAWTTFVGSLPLTAAVTLLGSRAENLSLTDPILWGTVALLIVLLAAVRLVDIERVRSSRH